MKVTTKMRRYHFGTTFKIGDAGILVLGSIGVLGSIVLFNLGMAWVIMAAYQNSTVNDTHFTWGIVMMCMGVYLVVMNALAVTMSAIALNNRDAKKTLWIAIFAIFAIVPIIPGVILLFTPLNIDDNHKPLVNNNKFMPQDKERLQTLKTRIDQGTASSQEEQEFKRLLANYRQTREVN